MINYVVVYEKSATGWAAYVPDLPGVITTGKSKEETQQLIREAIDFILKVCAKITYQYRNQRLRLRS